MACYKKKYYVGNITLLLESDCKIQCSEEFNDFISFQKPDYRIRLHEASILKTYQNSIFKDYSIEIFNVENKYVRQFKQTLDGIYAQSYSDYRNKSVDIFYLKKGIRNINHENGAFFHIGWEDILLNKKHLLLHACCIDTN